VEIWLCPTLYVYYWTCAGISVFIDGLLYSARYALKYSAARCWLLSEAFLLHYRDTARHVFVGMVFNFPYPVLGGIEMYLKSFRCTVIKTI